MNDQQWNAIDNIPVLSDVVIPGVVRVEPDPHVTPLRTAPDRSLTEFMRAQADILLMEMQQRIECMVEEALAHAHSSALETARLELQQRLRMEMEERLNAFIAGALLPRDV